MSELLTRLAEVRRRMAAAAQRAGRAPDAARLIAISKTVPAERVAEVARAGVRAIGESRVQEASHKIPEVRALVAAPLEWHLVGQLQRNKARRAAELFDVIHSLDRAELALELSRQAVARGRSLRALLQVNIDEEPQKGGVLPGRAAALLQQLEGLEGLEVVGLMAVPRACADPEQVRPSFARLRALREELERGRPAARRLVELSMGMSADYEIAIEEGATWVRVGSALFGERGAA